MVDHEPLPEWDVERVTRDLIDALIIGEAQNGFDLTETMIWISLRKNILGMSLHALSKRISRDRTTIRRRLRMMAEMGVVARDGDVWRVTDEGVSKGSERFAANFGTLPYQIKKDIHAASEARKKK